MGTSRRNRRRRSPRKAPERVDLDASPDAPLTEAEQRVMARHLAFFRKYRKVLRLRLNAKESQLVDGSIAADHRGTCKHLLAKLDRNAVQAALSRQPLSDNAEARVEFLAGATGACKDVAVVLDYLEALEQAESRGAARAFADAVRRIDLTALSPARFGRLLTLMRQVHDEGSLAQVLFGLLDNPAFASTWKRCADEVPKAAIAPLKPLRVVHDATRGRPVQPGSRRELEKGLHMLLTGGLDALKGHPRKTRVALAKLALELGPRWAPDASGVDRILADLGSDGAELHTLRARRYAELGRTEAALRVLEKLKGSDHAPAAELKRWLRCPAVGPIALKTRAPCLFAPGWHLKRSKPVRVRVAAPEVLAEATRLHAGITLPGVVPVLEHGIDGDLAWVTVPARLPPLAEALPKDLSIDDARVLAADGVRILGGLALGGIVLPDADPARFLGDCEGRRPQLWLGDLIGAMRAEPAIASVAMIPAAKSWVAAALAWPPLQGMKPRREASGALQDAVDAAATLEALIGALEDR